MEPTQGSYVLTQSYSSSYDDIFSTFCDLVLTYSLRSVIFSCFVILFGIATGIFLLVVIAKQEALRHLHLTFLNHFVVSTFLLLSVMGPITVETTLKPCWNFGAAMCKLTFMGTTVLTNACVFFLIIITFQEIDFNRGRYSRGYNSTKTQSVVTCLTVWSVAVLLAIPEALMIDIREAFGPQFCTYSYTHPTHINILIAKMNFVEFVAPLIFLIIMVPIVCYFRGFKRSHMTTDNNEDSAPPPADSFWLIIVLVVTFFIAYFPRFLSRFMESLFRGQGEFVGYQSGVWHVMEIIDGYVLLIHLAVVPFLVMTMSRVHRLTIVKIYQVVVAKVSGRGWEGHQQDELLEDTDDTRAIL